MDASASTSSFPQIVFNNGREIKPAEATISVLGEVLYGAFGVYESIQLWNGVIFHLEDHLRRLERSAALIELPLAASIDVHRSWVERLVEIEGAANATIRLFAIGPDMGQAPQTFIWLEASRPPARSEFERGVGAVTVAGERALPGAKSLNTLVNTMARRRARAAGAHEGLLLNRDQCITEGASSNFGVIIGDAIHLPPALEILSGVTLEILLSLAHEDEIEILRRPLPLGELISWDGAFLSSTSRHILPLVTIDGRPIGEGRPNRILQHLQRRFEAHFEMVTGAAYLPG